jgi:L-2,4-diaminobutyric acid acetyltransferase
MYSDKEVPEDTQKQRVSGLTLRTPRSEDGFALHELVAASPPLDPNSVYCNLLQCSHFAETAVAAEQDGDLVGFTSGYLLPNRPDTLFVWQIVIAEQARGCGLAKRMLKHLLARPVCKDVRKLETTITPDNEASWALFRSLARDLGAELTSKVWFERERHFGELHDDEHLLHIAPISPKTLQSES